MWTYDADGAGKQEEARRKYAQLIGKIVMQKMVE